MNVCVAEKGGMMKYKKHGTCLKCKGDQDLLWWLRIEVCGKCMDIDTAIPKEYQKTLIRLAKNTM